MNSTTNTKKSREKNYKLYDQLVKYFEETPKEQLDIDWLKVEHWNNIGPDADEYTEFIKQFRK
jgi:hypothetical protein